MFNAFQLSSDQYKKYTRNGFLVVKNLFTDLEIEKLFLLATEDEQLSKNAFDLNDVSGKKTKLSLWYTAGDDPFGLMCRTQRIISAVDALMEGESPVCHFHTKLLHKEPRVGGSWEWHQDYGYWYKNEFLFPEQMLSVMTALSPANKENGCLQVIPGSHKMGRVEHGFSGDQVGAAQRYVDLALKTLPIVYVELDPGDVLFFHSNILHRSEANLSNTSRWSVISCYNRAANIPYNEPMGSSTNPLTPVEDDSILQSRLNKLDQNARFLEKDKDEALK